MPLQLFALRDTTTKQLLTEFFHNKAAARVRRDALNAEAGSVKFCVALGPDHRRFKAA